MRTRTLPALLLSLAVLTLVAGAQVIYYHDNSNPASGAANTIPWSQTGNYSSLHVYPADQLQAAGVAPGSVLTDFAVAPSSTGPGTYSAPTARMLIGHLLYDTQNPQAWTSNLDTPIVIWDVASGAYTFPWAGSTWVSLPGFSTAGFVWDGVRDIGVFYTSQGASGGFSVRNPGLLPRFGVTTYNATVQTPTTTGFFAMKARLTFGGVLPQANTPQATMTINGSTGATHLAGTELLTINLASTTAANNPFFLLLSTSFTGGHIPLAGQSFDLGYAPAFFGDVLIATPGGLTPFLTGPLLPFASLDGAGNFTLPLALGCGSPLGKTFLQAAILDPSHPDGFRTTAVPSVDIKTACRYTSSNTFPIQIPDAGAPVTATISVPPGTIIGDLDVMVNIFHVQYSDVAMTLDLNGVPLVNLMIAGPTDATDLNGKYTFSDEAQITLDAAATTSGTTIVPGRYIPDSPLSAFDGLDAGGVWTLTVTDTVATMTGQIQGFQILINGVE